jgi:hypothetical protein
VEPEVAEVRLEDSGRGEGETIATTDRRTVGRRTRGEATEADTERGPLPEVEEERRTTATENEAGTWAEVG